MKRKKKIIFLFTLLLAFGTVPQASASGMTDVYYPPSHSDYSLKRITWKIYNSYGVEKVKITQFSAEAKKKVIEEVTWKVKPNSFIWVDMSCKGDTTFEWFDGNGKKIDMITRGQTDSYLGKGACKKGKTIKLSDYNEKEKRYASDTFGGTKKKLKKPKKADGSGGTGKTGYIRKE